MCVCIYRHQRLAHIIQVVLLFFFKCPFYPEVSWFQTSQIEQQKPPINDRQPRSRGIMHVWWGFQICTCECWPKFVTCTAISYMQLHSTSFYFYYTLSLYYIYIKICITFERLKSTRHEACFFVLSDMTSQSQWVSQLLRQGTFRAKPWVELHPMRHMSHGLRHAAGADGPAGVSRLSGRTVSKRRLRSRQEHGGPTSS